MSYGTTISRSIAGLAVAGLFSIAVAPGTATAVPAPRAVTAPNAVSIPSFNATMIQLINQARQQNGRAPLAEAKGLDAVATGWSNKLNTGVTGYQLQHDPNAWTEVAANGASNRTSWGENVAWSSSTSTSAQSIFTAYMNSPGHRANILSASYHYIGMGTATGSHGLWNTTEFTDKVEPGQVVSTTKTPTAAQKSLVTTWYRSPVRASADRGRGQQQGRPAGQRLVEPDCGAGHSQHHGRLGARDS